MENTSQKAWNFFIAAPGPLASHRVTCKARSATMWMNGSLTVAGGGVLTPFQRKICSSALQSERRTGLAEGAGYTLLEEDKDRAGSEDMLSVSKTGNTVSETGI